MTHDRPPITDSPWFWVYLYAVAGLIALALVQPRFGARQAQIERKYQGRQRAVEQQMGRQPTTKLSTRHDTLITLRPLYLILAALFAVAWSVLWWRHFRVRPGRTTSGADDAESEPVSTGKENQTI